MIFLVCALHCEARPLVEKYRLTVDRDAFFPVFHNDDMVLVVSGVGKLLTASAMAYVFSRYNEPASNCWLNVGVAGMKSAGLGQLFNINKVTEQSSGTNWYPVRLIELAHFASCAAITLDEPGKQYEENVAFDMEASAFMLTALRFSTVEFVQLIKIISDTEVHLIDNVSKQLVTDLVRQNISQIDEVVNVLRSASSDMVPEPIDHALYEKCIAQWRFSEYQKKSLARKLQQWDALNENININDLAHCRSGKQVLEFLAQVLKNNKIEFSTTS